MTNSLLVCPFCGRGDLLGFEPTGEGGFLAVKCRACGTHGPAKLSTDEREAAAHWNRRAENEPLPGHLRQGIESVDAHELTVPAIRERAAAFNHWFRTNGGFKGYEAQAIDSLLDFIGAQPPCPGEHEDPDFKREDGSCAICSPQPPASEPRDVRAGTCHIHGDYLGEFCTASKPGQETCFYSSKLGRRVTGEEARAAQLTVTDVDRAAQPPRVQQDAEGLAWALQVHEDLAEYTKDIGGNMLHTRAHRALGIVFAEVEKLEKALYPALTKPDVPSKCPGCHSGRWYAKNGPTGAQETCKHPWHEQAKERAL